MPTLLHVGCGRKDIRSVPSFFQDGTWQELRLDIDPSVKPHIIGSITDMSSVKSGSIDAVFSSHNIEHLFPHEVPTALSEFKRTLASDGLAVITCPDLQTVAQLVVNDKLLETAYESAAGPVAPLDMLFGHRVSIAAGNYFMAHRGGFTASSLSRALVAAGFRQTIAKRRPEYFDIWVMGAVAHASREEMAAKASRIFPS